MNLINPKSIVKFLDENYPSLLLDLQEEGRVTSWIEEQCSVIGETTDEAEFFLALCRELGVSQYNYIQAILEEDFPGDHQRLLSAGVLKFELINISLCCAEVFNAIPLTEEKEDIQPLRLAVTGVISDYLYQSSVA